MRILAVGGGSGGHVTPVVAVIRDIREHHPNTDIRFWCDKNFAPEARRIMADYDPSIKVRTIISGKFRRYHHLSAVQHITTPSVIFPNIRDAFNVLFGTVQSIFLLISWRPSVVFLKGGFVCLPVGWAAWLLRIPIVIHDSDAHPGLTNRLLAPLARKITTGVSLDHYNYPPEKSSYVGIPIDPVFRVVSDEARDALKKKLGFHLSRPLTVFIGGGQGARQINDAVALHLRELNKRTDVFLLSGTTQYDELRSLTPSKSPHFRLEAFMPPGELVNVLMAADVVVSRAGATTLLELAAMAKPTIVVPSKRLLWQVKHAQLYVDMQAVDLLDEDSFVNPEDTSLVDVISRVLTNEQHREKLAKNLHRLARPHAAHDLAEILIHAARKQR